MGLEVDGKRGVMNHYGPRKSGAPSVGGQTGVFNTKFAEWVFDFDDAPTPDGDNDMQYIIPAGSLIIGATWKVITQGAGDTLTNEIGLNAADNATTGADDPNGLFTTTNLATAILKKAPTVALSGLKAGGDQVGLIMPVDSTLEVTQTGTATAGRYQVIVEYQPLSSDGVGSK